MKKMNRQVLLLLILAMVMVSACTKQGGTNNQPVPHPLELGMFNIL